MTPTSSIPRNFGTDERHVLAVAIRAMQKGQIK
jgi:hypothetical protein